MHRGNPGTRLLRWGMFTLLTGLALSGTGARWAADEEAQAGKPAAVGKVTSNGTFYVEWRPVPDPVPLNEMFEIRFRVSLAEDREKPVPGAVVTATAFMPEHNHGTTLQPQVESHGDGTATARGFLLQMEGHWELRVAVALNGQMERATFDIHLEP